MTYIQEKHKEGLVCCHH